MPQLIFKSIECKKLCEISKDMVNELQSLLECPKSYFTLEIANSTYIMDGKIVENYPIVDILWFDRGQEIQDQVAKIVTKYVNSVGYKDVDVIFNILKENMYYENGEHF